MDGPRLRPQQQFRLWAREAPFVERLVVSVGVVAIMALLAWLLVPDGSQTTDDVALATTDGTLPHGRSPDGAPAAVSAPAEAAQQAPLPASGVSGSGTRGPDPSASVGEASSSASVCGSPSGSAPGVSANEVKVAVVVTNIVGPAANSLFGVDSPDEQRSYYQAAIDGLNREGGIGCRKVAPTYYPVNPADASDMQQTCLRMRGDGMFAVLDTGNYSAVGSGPVCFVQQKLPYFTGYFLSQRMVDQGYPYVFGIGHYDRLYRNAMLAFHDRGFFSPEKGFKRIGVIWRSCFPELPRAAVDALKEAGVDASHISTYDFGCPTAFASPADIQQAVLKFAREGVTHMTQVNAQADFSSFTNVAEQQGFRPQWIIPDDQVIATSGGSQAPNKDNIANAVAVTQSRNGEERTPGMAPTPGTVRCDGYLQAAGLERTWRQAWAAGTFCDVLWMLQASVENAPELRQDALPAGLAKAGSIDFSFPHGPSDFSGSRVTTGGQFWRVAQFMPDCGCWRVIEREFEPTYR